MTALAKLPEKWRALAALREKSFIAGDPVMAVAYRACADELSAALSPAELGGAEEGVEAIQRLLDCAELAVGFRGFQADDDNEVVVLRDAIREAKPHIVSLSTPRAAEAVTEEMVERALDAMFGSPFGSLSAALASALGYSAMYARADRTWRNVYDVSIESDGVTIDNRDGAMRAALAAALTPPSAKGE